MRARRLRLADSAAAVDHDEWLGALAYGAGMPEGAGPIPRPLTSPFAGFGGPLLGGPEAAIDAWSGGTAPIASGRCGGVRWRSDGEALFGALDIDERNTDGSLEDSVAQGYRDIFAALAGHPGLHLLRLWNSMPAINADDASGVERYRVFNSGRQRAFVAAGCSAFDGAPAACAVGTRAGLLQVRFLAARVRPVAIENPRQVSAYRYPEAYGAASPSFSRAVLFDAGANMLGLLISGTASIVGHESQHPGDVQAQARETLVNLQAVIDTANARGSARYSIGALEPVVYLREPAHLAPVRGLLEAALGADCAFARNAVFVQADLCRRELLIEIEAHAFTGGRLR